MTLALIMAAFAPPAAIAQEVGDFKLSVIDDDHGEWFLADGRAVSRVDWDNLFDAIGTAFGTGDGSTTFNLPDMRGRMPMMTNNSALPNGADSGLTTRDLGDVLGAETHALTLGQLPAHAHGAGSFAAGGGSPTITFYSQGETTDPDVPYVSGGSTDRGGSGTVLGGAISGGGGGSVTGTSASAGNSEGHPIIGPVAVAGNAFIFAGAMAFSDPDFASVVMQPDFSLVAPVDDSPSGHTLTLLQNADTANGSLDVDLDGAVLAPDSSDWDLGTGDFTIEGYIEIDGYGASNASIIAATIPNTGFGAGGWSVRIWAAQGIDMYSEGDIIIRDGENFMQTTDPFTHFAITREGNTMRSFKDGVLTTSSTFTGALNTSLTNGLVIADYTNHESPHPMDGRLKGFRITKGVARYTAAFTPPTLPLPTQ